MFIAIAEVAGGILGIIAVVVALAAGIAQIRSLVQQHRGRR